MPWPAREPTTPARIEHALVVLVGIILQRDAAAAARLAPIYERLERELEDLQRDDVRSRARRRLEAARLTPPPAR